MNGKEALALSLQFFLSYARDDDLGGLIADFYRDLERAFKDRLGSGSVIGYFDNNGKPGKEWRPEIVETLLECNVFVPLVSPTYVTRTYCGQEWWIFERRLKTYEHTVGRRVSLLVPLLWTPIDLVEKEIPEPVKGRRYINVKLGSIYQDKGLGYLVRLKGHYRKDYEDFLIELVKMIGIEAAEHSLPRGQESYDLENVPSAFSTQADGGIGSARSERINTTKNGPRHVHVVIAAASKAELVAQQVNLNCYGQRTDDWAPYYPDAPEPLILYTQEILSKERLIFHPCEVDVLASLLQEAEERNELVLIMVDPWTVMLERYRDHLKSYDNVLLLNTGVMIPWNKKAAECTSSAELVLNKTHTLFRKNMKENRITFRSMIVDVDEFRSELRGLLLKLQEFVFEQHDVPRPAVSNQFIPQPNIKGPVGTNG